MNEENQGQGALDGWQGETKVRSKLTDKEELFCRKYMTTLVGSRAVIEAGYTDNIESAYAIAYQLKRLPHIKARLKELQTERNKEYEITIERVGEEWAKLAFADTTRLVEEFGGKDGKLEFKSLKEIPPELRPAIKSISQYKNKINVTFHDKASALDALSKHLGFYEVDNRQKAPAGVAIYLPDNGRDPAQAVKEALEARKALANGNAENT